MSAFKIFSRFSELLDIKVARPVAAWLRLNADGTVTERTAAQTLSDLGGISGITNANVNSAIASNPSGTRSALELATTDSPTWLGATIGTMSFVDNNGFGFPGIKGDAALSIHSGPGGVNFGRNYPVNSMNVVMALAPQGLMVSDQSWDHANGDTAPQNGTIRTKVGHGTNIAGGSLKLVGGIATGNAKTGDVLIMRCDAAASGTGPQTEISAWKFDGQTGDAECLTTGAGLICKSPNGTRWRLTPDDSGNSVWTAL